MKRLTSVLAALAVLVVSTTCSSAGCLLPTIHAKTPAQKQSACCGGKAHSDRQSSHDSQSKHCPVCDHPVANAAGDIHKARGIEQSETVIAFLTVSSHLQAAPFVIAPAAMTDSPPAVGPPTLLRLHCALLI